MGPVLPDRREAIVRLGLAIAGLASAGRSGRAGTLPVEANEISVLSASIRDATRDGAWDAARDAIRAGASPEIVLGAVFLAGVEDIRPRPHGILHAAMMVESACQLSAASGGTRAAWHPVLFNLDDLKTAQEEDRAEWSDYRMKPLPTAPRGTVDGASRALLAALDAYDPERAERAAAALAALVDGETFFGLLRPASARCHAFIGHKAIYAVQVERMLRRIGWSHAEPAVRSLVLAMLVGRETEGYESARELARTVPASALAAGGSAGEGAGGRGGEDGGRGVGGHGGGDGDGGGDRDSLDLVGALRGASPNAAVESMAAALRGGLGSRAAWDAVVLVGADVFERRPGRRSADGRGALLPVHAVTVASALRSSFEASRDEATKGLLLLQAASWVARVRDALVGIVGLSMTGPSLAAASDAPASLEAVLETGSPAAAMGFLERDAAGAGPLLSRMRDSLARRGREHHQHKLAAALGEEAARVDARLRARLLSPAVDYLASPKDAETEVFGRAERTLDAAGIARGA